MATTVQKPMNMLQKLAQARLMFLNEHVKKSGKNIKLEFEYFELKDIVPSATRIFADLGIASIDNFTSEQAVMSLYNADDTTEGCVEVAIPYREAGQIISKAGKEVTNPLQALGASITYMRRYLYMLALDIVEDDETDANLGSNTETPAKKEKPATAAERKAVKEELTEEQSKPATAEQLEHLKELCKALMLKDQSQKDLISGIGLKSKGFTEFPAEQCSQLISHLEAMIKAYEGKE